MSTLCREAEDVLRGANEKAAVDSRYDPLTLGDWRHESLLMVPFNAFHQRAPEGNAKLLAVYHHFQARWARLGLPVVRLTTSFAAELILREPDAQVCDLATPLPAFMISLPRNSPIPAFAQLKGQKLAPTTSIFVHMRRHPSEGFAGEVRDYSEAADAMTAYRVLTYGVATASPSRYGGALPMQFVVEPDDTTSISSRLSEPLVLGGPATGVIDDLGLRTGYRVVHSLVTRLLVNLCLELAQNPLGEPASFRRSQANPMPHVWPMGSEVPDFGDMQLAVAEFAKKLEAGGN